jgi:2-dehydropantoate 2-reductase
MTELERGLRVCELNGSTRVAHPVLATEPSAASSASIVLVTVKSAATAEAARELAPVLAKSCVVVSLQNGVRNVTTLRDALPDQRVLAGMVPFNVVRRAPGEYMRATAGSLMLEAHAAMAPLADACRRADLATELRDDMPAVQWSKLVLNLNNAINALSGMPLVEELANRDFRRCLAACQREALLVLDAAQQPVARVMALPTSWLSRVLAAPDRVFNLLAKRIVAMDPLARSSMWDDLEAKRPTEIDFIQGEIVLLAERLGMQAPLNRTLVGLVKDAERGGKRRFTGAELYAALGRP